MIPLLTAAIGSLAVVWLVWIAMTDAGPLRVYLWCRFVWRWQVVNRIRRADNRLYKVASRISPRFGLWWFRGMLRRWPDLLETWWSWWWNVDGDGLVIALHETGHHAAARHTLQTRTEQWQAIPNEDRRRYSPYYIPRVDRVRVLPWVWQKSKDAEQGDLAHLCDYHEPDQCTCKGACSCHWSPHAE